MTVRYVGRRLIQVPVAVSGILLAGFLLIHLTPGDPILALAGDHGDAAYYAFMREKFGLDRPLIDQLLTYAGNVLRADLGVSYVHGRPVAAVVGERLPATLLLTLSALVISSVVGIGLGLLAASRAHRWPDLLISVGTLVLYAAPVFWLAQACLLVLALGLGWFPVSGTSTAGFDGEGLTGVLDVARHLALPVLVLATQEVAAVARLTRVGLLEELRNDYVRTARAKGLTEHRVLSHHALRRALLPVATIIGGRTGHLLSGAVLVEIVFGWPGIGRLLLSAVQTRDAPILLGIFLVVAVTVIIANLLTDIVYGWLDPRIRYG
ncbi:MAG: ABC transporter permease [Chloroflexi bacterium]|nr:ABC transporter permease [Chloroflexota bacterium]